MELGAGMGLVASWLCVHRAAPELTAACLAEQMEGLKGETLGMAIQNQAGAVIIPSAILCWKTWSGLTLAWQSCLLLQLGNERGRSPGLAPAFLIFWRYLFCQSDSV